MTKAEILAIGSGKAVGQLIGKSLSPEYEKLCQDKINAEIKEIHKEYAAAYHNAKNVWVRS